MKEMIRKKTKAERMIRTRQDKAGQDGRRDEATHDKKRQGRQRQAKDKYEDMDKGQR
jgi:hypothetical protein